MSVRCVIKEVKIAVYVFGKSKERRIVMEDYEKKYKDAMGMAEEIIRYYKEHNRGDENSIEDLEGIFPELKESGDEKIRKALIEYFNEQCDMSDWNGVYGYQVVAWLEKQKSVKEIVERCKSSWYSEGKIAGMAEGLTNDEKYQQGWHDALENQGKQKPTSDIRYEVNAGGSLSVVNGKPFDYEKATITQNDFASVGETATIELSSPIDCCDRIYHVSHKPIEKHGEQKQEWSEEDEKMANDLIEGFLSSEKTHHLVHTSKEIVDWLKSLKYRVQGKE